MHLLENLKLTKISLFCLKADVEGFNDVAAVFRSTAEGETGHAHGHLEYLEALATLQLASHLVIRLPT